MPFFDHYPYTNFHNVNLDWVLQAVKSWGALVEQNNIAFHNLEEANAAFKEYVTGYITNLDVQEEINAKIDDMVSSGELGTYLSPYVHSEVTEWLDDNITPTSPPLDTSLTVAGAAADAKATGEAIDNVEVVLRPELLTGQMKNMLWNLLQCAAYDGDSDYLTALNNFKNSWGVPAPAIVYKGKQNALVFARSLSNQYSETYQSYTSYNLKRFCYTGTDIRTRAGYTYRVTVSNYDTNLAINVRIYQSDIDTVIANKAALAIRDDSGWVTISNSNGVLDITASNSSMMLFQFALANDATPVQSQQYFSLITIEELAE